MEKRISLYWHNGRSLGHTSIISGSSVGVYSTMFREVLFWVLLVHREGFELLPDKMDIVKLPSYLSYDSQQGVERTPILSIPQQEFQNIRENIIKETMLDFHPKVLIAKHHPIGRNGELISAIKVTPRTIKVWSARGIIKEPEDTNRVFFNPEMIQFIQDYYYSIHVHIDPKIFCMEDYYHIEPGIKKMIKYTGYLARSFEGTKSDARKYLGLDESAKIILVNFGGG